MQGKKRYIISASLCLLIGTGSIAQERRDNVSGETTRGIADSLRKIANSLENANAPATVDSGCAPDQDNRQSDLCAQWKAADAAHQSADAADSAVLIGWIGLVFGALTMASAIAAALYAKRAARATEETVKIAKDAATEAKDSVDLARQGVAAANRQAIISEKAADERSRPYMVFEGVQISPVTNAQVRERIEDEIVNVLYAEGWAFSITFRNAGITPAVGVVFNRADKLLIPIGSEIPKFDEFPESDASGAVLGPDKSGSANPIAIGGTDLVNLQNREIALILHATCRYKSIHKSDCEYKTDVTVAININGLENHPDGRRNPRFITEIAGFQNMMT